MCSKLKKYVYWFTFIGPIFDVLKGTYLGLRSVYEDVQRERLEQEQRDRFEQDNKQIGV